MTFAGTFVFRGCTHIQDMTEKFEESVDHEEAWKLVKKFIDIECYDFSIPLENVAAKTYKRPLLGIDLLGMDGNTFIVSYSNNEPIGLAVSKTTLRKWKAEATSRNDELNAEIRTIA